MNIIKAKSKPVEVKLLQGGECFKTVEASAENEVYMIVIVGPTIINKDANSIPPADEAVFAVNISTGRFCLFDKDVEVFVQYATCHYGQMQS